METRIIKGDALKILQQMPSDTIDCVMTSPPYWALRDYGVKGQLGLEEDPQEYIRKLCDIFDEIKRVLKPTGTCWVNISDTYSANRWTGDGKGQPMNKNKDGHRSINPKKKSGLPDKTLVGIPQRFMLEMIARGWICRNEIIWHKPNCMPASVKDRFTIDYEKLFFFTKSQKYYFKQQFQPLADATLPRYGRAVSDKIKYNQKSETSAGNLGKPRPNTKHFEQGTGGSGTGLHKHSGYYKADGRPNFYPEGRNMRAVWKISTKSFKGAHFAVYPPELCQIPIRAGSPPNGIVLDPFMGSGTTLQVAREEGRRGLGIELNGEYIKIAKKRIKGVGIQNRNLKDRK